jgi:hypothetical protein
MIDQNDAAFIKRLVDRANENFDTIRNSENHTIAARKLIDSADVVFGVWQEFNAAWC